MNHLDGVQAVAYTGLQEEWTLVTLRTKRQRLVAEAGAGEVKKQSGFENCTVSWHFPYSFRVLQRQGMKDILSLAGTVSNSICLETEGFYLN